MLRGEAECVAGYRIRGLTLPEIIVALGLIAVAALSLISAFLGGYRMMEQSTDLCMASEISRELLETVKSNGYDKTSVGTFDGRLPSLPDGVTGFPPGPYPVGRRNTDNYPLRVECTQYSPTTRLVKVVVYWSDIHHTEVVTMMHR